MRKTLMVSAVALVLGFVIGIVCSSIFILPAGSQLHRTISVSTVSLPPVPAASIRPAGDTADMDFDDNVLLRCRADQALDALKDADYARLAALVHPERGVSFTPYSTVHPDSDLRLMPAQVATLTSDSKRYVWGNDNGAGEPIRMTISEYFAEYVFNTDYTQAPEIGVDTVMETGNALENVADAFPDCRFVEYHFPSIEPKNKGFDWCSLKLVFAPYEGDWRLVAFIHSEWTI